MLEDRKACSPKERTPRSFSRRRPSFSCSGMNPYFASPGFPMIVFPMENDPPGLYRMQTHSGMPPWVRSSSMSVISSRLINAPSSLACVNSSGGMAFADRIISSPEKPQAFARISSVAEEQSSPQPSSFRIRRIAGFGSALTAKYSLKSRHQANALFSSRARLRIPASSYR